MRPDRHPRVDVNLFVYNGMATLPGAIESVLAQSWPDITLTLIDNASTDDTPAICARYAAEDRRIRVQRVATNQGPIANCQRAFAAGDSAFILPKTADDLLDPDFIARVMAELLAHPDCAMCHAAGLTWEDHGRVTGLYPPTHRLWAVGDDPVARAAHVMTTYTSAPAFWGIYRRAAVEKLRRIQYRAGWDHVLLAELALYGEIRHVPEVLFLRHQGGKPVNLLAWGCTEACQRGVSQNDPFADPFWRTPLITTAHAHIDMFALCRLALAQRLALMDLVAPIFRARWLPLLQLEVRRLLADMPGLRAGLADLPPAARTMLSAQLDACVAAASRIVPDMAAAAA